MPPECVSPSPIRVKGLTHGEVEVFWAGCTPFHFISDVVSVRVLFLNKRLSVGKWVFVADWIAFEKSELCRRACDVFIEVGITSKTMIVFEVMPRFGLASCLFA